jgi:hypothetical protein
VRETLSAEGVCVEVGGIPIFLQTADDAFRRILLERYAGFVTEQPAQRAIDVRLQPPAKDSDPDADISVERSGQVWRLRRGDFEAEWNPNDKRGWVRQSPNPHSIDTALRIIYSLELVEHGGFLLHSSSLVRNQRAFLFSGVSGAGKTTISRLAPQDATLLTDEISYIRPQSGSYRAHGTPFAGELGKPGENVSAPIAQVFLLAKGQDNRIEEVDTVTAIRALLRNVLFFAADPVLRKRLLDIACDFVSRVPMSRLTFYPDHRVWDLVK